MDLSDDFYASLTPDTLEDAQQSYPPFCNSFLDTGVDFPFLNTAESVCPSLLADTSSTEDINTAYSHQQKCSCSEMVRTYEKAEMYLVWAPRDHSGAVSIEVDEVLRCQKTVLASCEAVLSCNLCHLQSEKVMLMISICNKLLASLVNMSIDLPSITQRSVTPSRSEYNSPRCEMPIGGVHGRGLNFELNVWKIDDEDKNQVLRSLINARATRLEALLDKIGEKVTTNSWLVHRSMIRDLIQRFAEHQGSWKP